MYSVARGLSTAGASPLAPLPTEPLTVYGRTSSSNTQKVLFALELIGASYDLVPASARIGPSQRYLTSLTGEQPYGVVGTEGYAALNPHHAIPTLITERGDSIWESHTIVRYLEAMYGLGDGIEGRGVASASASALAQARSSMWMDWILYGGDFGPAFATANHRMIDEVARTPVAKRDQTTILLAHKMYVDRLAKVETYIGQAGSQYLCGDDVSAADVAMGTEINRWSLCVHAAASSGFELKKPDFPCLKQYYSELMGIPAFVTQVFENERDHHGLPDEAGFISLAAKGE